MDNKKIFIGLGVLAIGAYFFYKKKSSNDKNIKKEDSLSKSKPVVGLGDAQTSERPVLNKDQIFTGGKCPVGYIQKGEPFGGVAGGVMTMCIKDKSQAELKTV
jgi:hypothetical protein